MTISLARQRQFRNWRAGSLRLDCMGIVTRLDEIRRAKGAAQRVKMSDTEDRVVRAHRYRRRAQELRSISEEVMLKETSLTLLSLAESYDQMASVMEKMSCDKN